MAWIALLKSFRLMTTCKQPLPNSNGQLSSKVPSSEDFLYKHVRRQTTKFIALVC